MYVAESVGSNRITKVLARNEDYDIVLDAFNKHKHNGSKEVRMAKVEHGIKTVLKSIINGRKK